MASRKQVVAAGFIIYRRIQHEIEYLLLHASYEKNLWSPPKGHVDPGESEFETALRETNEEAGLSRSHLSIIETFQKVLNYEVRGKQKRVVYWLSELKDPATPIVLSDEHVDYKWLGLDEALRYAKFPDMQAALNDVDVFLKSQL